MENQTKKRNANRTLPNGETVSLLFFPGQGWIIREYEFSLPRFDPGSGFVFLDRYHGAARHWKELRFESADEAAAYVEREISAGHIPGIAKAEDVA
jgi:hypothetical protein